MLYWLSNLLDKGIFLMRTINYWLICSKCSSQHAELPWKLCCDPAVVWESSSLPVCRQNGFRVITWHWKKVDIDLGYCNPMGFKPRGPEGQKWKFLFYLYMERFFFHQIQALLWNYYCFWHKRGQKGGWTTFNLLKFSS